MNFVYIDRPGAPQEPTLELQCLTPREEIWDESPWERDEGFWPSEDPNAPGYVPPDRFDAEMRKAEERAEAWKVDEWWYVGVQARAIVSLPVGGDSFVIYTIDSPGVWGIESDSTDYIKAVFEEEAATLTDHMQALGKVFEMRAVEERERLDEESAGS